MSPLGEKAVVTAAKLNSGRHRHQHNEKRSSPHANWVCQSGRHRIVYVHVCVFFHRHLRGRCIVLRRAVATYGSEAAVRPKRRGPKAREARALVLERLPRAVQLQRDEAACGKGKHHNTPLQKWHLSCLASHLVHNGVICPTPHCSFGYLSAALQYSHQLPVYSPQSTHAQHVTISRSSSLRSLRFIAA